MGKLYNKKELLKLLKGTEEYTKKEVVKMINDLVEKLKKEIAAILVKDRPNQTGRGGRIRALREGRIKPPTKHGSNQDPPPGGAVQ